jgi:hypothetical protein
MRTLIEIAMVFATGLVPKAWYVGEVAAHFEVDRDLAMLTWKYESSYGTDLYGDWDEELGEYLAVGDWQIHPGTWLYLVEKYDEAYGCPETWYDLDTRLDFEASTIISMYAFSIGREDWWAGARLARLKLEEDRKAVVELEVP